MLHASTFFAALQGAEALVFPNPYLPRGVFIEVLDLLEYAQLQLSFEELALTLSNARAMHRIVTELSSIPVQTLEAKGAG